MNSESHVLTQLHGVPLRAASSRHLRVPGYTPPGAASRSRSGIVSGKGILRLAQTRKNSLVVKRRFFSLFLSSWVICIVLHLRKDAIFVISTNMRCISGKLNRETEIKRDFLHDNWRIPEHRHIPPKKWKENSGLKTNKSRLASSATDNSPNVGFTCHWFSRLMICRPLPVQSIWWKREPDPLALPDLGYPALSGYPENITCDLRQLRRQWRAKRRIMLAAKRYGSSNGCNWQSNDENIVRVLILVHMDDYCISA